MPSAPRSRILLGLLAGAAAWLFQLGPIGHGFEQRGLDLLFALRGPAPAPDGVVIVAIDAPSFETLGLQWPWPRSLHARLVDRLRAAGARVIGFDVIFAEPSSEAEDTAFTEAIRRAGNVVLASDLRTTETASIQQVLHIRPLPGLREAAREVGAVNVVRDADGVIRSARPFLGDIPTFALSVSRAAGWTGRPPPGAFLINYLGPSPAVRTVSYADALAPQDLPAETFRGKIVLVGRATGPAGRPVDDSHMTPFGRRRPTPGVEIHATIVDTLLRTQPILRIGRPWALLWCVGAGLVAALAVGWPASPWWGGAVTAGLVGLHGAGALAGFAGPQLWLPWVAPVLATVAVYGGTLALRWRESEREKAFIRGAFQRYMHPALVQQLLEDPTKLRLGGESVDSTVLLSDLEGFTTIAEGMSPTELITFLNQYFAAMTEILLEHRGMLSRTMGDGILALWGVPVQNPLHPVDACTAALAMQRRLVALNAGWVAQDRPALRMRIGLQSGLIVVGNVGSAERFDYSPNGNEVILASRLEGLNKLYGTGIILGEETAARVGEAFVLRELDLIRVVGRNQPVRIFECVSEPAGLAEDARRLLQAFGEGLDAYRNRQWAGALERFECALALAPRDGPSRIYRERVRGFLATPPPSDWNGVYVAATKEG